MNRVLQILAIVCLSSSFAVAQGPGLGQLCYVDGNIGCHDAYAQMWVLGELEPLGFVLSCGDCKPNAVGVQQCTNRFKFFAETDANTMINFPTAHPSAGYLTNLAGKTSFREDSAEVDCGTSYQCNEDCLSVVVNGVPKFTCKKTVLSTNAPIRKRYAEGNACHVDLVQ